MRIAAVQVWAIMLAVICCCYAPAYLAAADKGTKMDTVEEEIWALEESYFANLYQANYEGVLARVHRQFLGWPSAVPQPIGRDESAQFMRKLVPKPTPYTLKIERAGIRVLGEVALTQYTLHATYGDTAGAMKTQSSRITHTWVKEGSRWQLLGGMSYDK